MISCKSVKGGFIYFTFFSVVLYLNGYMTTVLGHAISKITILESPTPEIKKILGSLLDDEPKHGGQWLEQRKSRLAQWLHDNRFPVRMERERIIVANVLEIAPPYSVNSCHTSNEIILGRIQRLIDTMPE